MAYLTYAEYLEQADPTRVPPATEGRSDQARIEALLDQAASVCVSCIPGALLTGDDDGTAKAASDLEPVLLAGCKRVSADWVRNELLARKERDPMLRETLCQELRGIVLGLRWLGDGDTAETDLDPSEETDPDETDLTPSTPVVTAHTNYLLASVNQVFTAPEVVASGTSSALEVPADTVPAGERRYFAYARLNSLGAYRYIYLYPAGHRDPQSQLAGFSDDGAVTEIDNAEQRLLRSRVSYASNAVGTVFEAR